MPDALLTIPPSRGYEMKWYVIHVRIRYFHHKQIHPSTIYSRVPRCQALSGTWEIIPFCLHGKLQDSRLSQTKSMHIQLLVCQRLDSNWYLVKHLMKPWVLWQFILYMFPTNPSQQFHKKSVFTWGKSDIYRRFRRIMLRLRGSGSREAMHLYDLPPDTRIAWAIRRAQARTHWMGWMGHPPNNGGSPQKSGQHC
jgi:hypothetical protein